ncbi:MAG TPA: glycosyl hydrolase family 18 protein [Cytophagaceae bacterium]|jgi:chitinase|nr:glycosyl hydrolase family 18 protein [Cytophagaceae bacterium]
MKVKITLLLLFHICISYSLTAQFKVIGYLPTWINYPNSVNNLQLTKLTHINIAFSNPDANGNLIPGDGTNADVTTVVTAAHAKNVKVFMSMGGAGAPGSTYHTLLNTTTSMNKFVDSIVSYATTYNLDGIDVDIEGDVLGPNVTAAKYEAFVTALATALHAKHKFMSAALAQWFGSYVTTAAAAQFDWINMMSYDAAIPGSGDAVGQHAPYSMVLDDFNYWNTTKSVPSTNLVVGVPFYGYGWGTDATPNNDEIPYCTIVANYPGADTTDQIGSGNDVIYYNGIPTIKKKIAYAKTNASGIMIWELTEDCNDNTSLLSAIDSIVNPAAVITAIESSSLLDSGYEVFPNPFDNTTTLKNKNSTTTNTTSIEITNVQGAVVESLKLTAGTDQTVVGASFNPGIYFIRIQDGDSSQYLRMIKK